jgi:NhaP-type Na+/H+ and K+/H+ antiporter
MTAPRDELMSTSQEDVRRARRKRLALGCLGIALASAGLLGLLALWLYNV